MINDSFKRFIQMMVLLALQMLVFNHIHLGGYAPPLVYVALLLYIPLNAPRVPNLIWAFVMGLLVDITNTTPGVGAAAMTVAAMCQPALLKMMMPRDATDTISPSYASMGVGNHMRYAAILIAIHHIVYFMLDFFSFHDVGEFFLYALGSYALTLVLVLLMERMRS